MTSKLIKTGLVLAAMLAAPFAANAADLRAPTYKAPAYVAPLAPSWTGFYVGLNAGYAFGDADWSAFAADPSPIRLPGRRHAWLQPADRLVGLGHRG